MVRDFHWKKTFHLLEKYACENYKITILLFIRWRSLIKNYIVIKLNLC